MKRALPERRLLVRCGEALLCLDLSQVKEVAAGQPGQGLALDQVLELSGSPALGARVTLETGGPTVEVNVDGVGGVVEVAPQDVLPVPAGALMRLPKLVRQVLRVPSPGRWHAHSLLPTAVATLVWMPLDHGTPALAVDLDPVVLGGLLLQAVAARPGGPP